MTKVHKLYPDHTVNSRLAHETEMFVLAGCMADTEACNWAIADLRSGDFTTPSHRLIWEAIVSLAQVGSTVDVLTVSEELVRMGCLESAGGLEGLANIAFNHIGASIQGHCTLLKNLKMNNEMQS